MPTLPYESHPLKCPLDTGQPHQTHWEINVLSGEKGSLQLELVCQQCGGEMWLADNTLWHITYPHENNENIRQMKRIVFASGQAVVQ